MELENASKRQQHICINIDKNNFPPNYLLKWNCNNCLNIHFLEKKYRSVVFRSVPLSTNSRGITVFNGTERDFFLKNHVISYVGLAFKIKFIRNMNSGYGTLWQQPDPRWHSLKRDIRVLAIHCTKGKYISVKRT